MFHIRWTAVGAKKNEPGQIFDSQIHSIRSKTQISLILCLKSSQWPY